jgi:hypothetical protein
VSVDDCPLQNTEGEAEAVSVGVGLTVTDTVCVFKHGPFAPTTVYIVVEVGVTATLLPVSEPGFQV